MLRPYIPLSLRPVVGLRRPGASVCTDARREACRRTISIVPIGTFRLWHYSTAISPNRQSSARLGCPSLRGGGRKDMTDTTSPKRLLTLYTVWSIILADCGVEQWQLVGLITRRSQVRILAPLPVVSVTSITPHGCGWQLSLPSPASYSLSVYFRAAECLSGKRDRRIPMCRYKRHRYAACTVFRIGS